jgi:tetratricopeptide (TPR) repeat protein
LLDEVSEAAKCAGDSSSSARAAVRRGALVRLKDPPRASKVLEDALEQCRNVGDAALESEALRHLAQATAFSGQLDRGSGAAAEAVAVARRVGNKALLFEALMCQGTIANIRDGHWHALPPFEEALDIARQAKNAEREADILMRTGYLRTELGFTAQAIDELETARTLCERTGNRRVLAYTLHNLGWALWKAGNAERARTAEEEALELSREAELGHVAVVTEIYLALFDVGEGNAAGGLERAQKARAISDEEGHAEPVMHADMVITLAFLALDQPHEAANAARHCIEAYERLGGTQQFEVEIHLVAQKAFEAAHDEEAAERSKVAADEALQRRLAPITDAAVREKLSNSIGEGLPIAPGRGVIS